MGSSGKLSGFKWRPEWVQLEDLVGLSGGLSGFMWRAEWV